MKRVRVRDTYVVNPNPDDDTSVSMNDPGKWKEDLAHYHSFQGQLQRKKRSLARKSKKKYLIWGLMAGLVVAFLLIFATYFSIYGL